MAWKLQALARRLLGRGFRLHNAGLSLVTPPERAAEFHLSAHSPHQDLPINAGSVWDGRVPPPSHPLSHPAPPPSSRLPTPALPTPALPTSPASPAPAMARCDSTLCF